MPGPENVELFFIGFVSATTIAGFIASLWWNRARKRSWWDYILDEAEITQTLDDEECIYSDRMLRVSIKDKNGETYSPYNPTPYAEQVSKSWRSSDENVALLQETGNVAENHVHIVGYGEATITVLINDWFSPSTTITVPAPGFAEAYFDPEPNPEGETFCIGDVFELAVHLKDLEGNIQDCSGTNYTEIFQTSWDYDQQVVILTPVGDNGERAQVEIIDHGDTTIKATINELTASANLTVPKPNIIEAKLNPDGGLFCVGEPVDVSVELIDTSGNLEDCSGVLNSERFQKSWHSDNNDVAVLSRTDNVTDNVVDIVGPGEATITVTVDDTQLSPHATFIGQQDETASGFTIVCPSNPIVWDEDQARGGEIGGLCPGDTIQFEVVPLGAPVEDEECYARGDALTSELENRIEWHLPPIGSYQVSLAEFYPSDSPTTGIKSVALRMKEGFRYALLTVYTPQIDSEANDEWDIMLLRAVDPPCED